MIMNPIGPGLIDHVSLQVSDVARSRAFYEPLLSPLGLSPAHTDGEAVGFANDKHAPFWILPAGRNADRELHLAFSAASREAVAQFHVAALAIAAEILHAPRLFAEYGPGYYACFVRDPDGHNVEAVCRDIAG